MCSKLVRAVSKGNSGQVQKLLSKDESLLNQCNQKGETALIAAVESGNDELFDYLLGFDNLDVNGGDHDRHPLNSALSTRNERFCKELFRRGSLVPSLVHHCIEAGMSTFLRLIFRTANPERNDDFAQRVRKEILARFGDNEQTIVHSAVIAGDPFLTDTLVRLIDRFNGQSSDYSSKTLSVDSNTPLDSPDAEGSDVNKLSEQSDICDSAELVNQKEDSDDTLVLNVDTKDREGRTPLWRAIESGDVSMAQALLKRRANVNLVNGDKDRTVCHLFCELFADFIRTPNQQSSDVGNEEAEYEEEEQKYEDEQDSEEESAVMVNSEDVDESEDDDDDAEAVANLRDALKNLLVEFKADFHQKDKYGLTPMDLEKSETERIQDEMEAIRLYHEMVAQKKEEERLKELEEQRIMEEQRRIQLAKIDPSTEEWLKQEGILEYWVDGEEDGDDKDEDDQSTTSEEDCSVRKPNALSIKVNAKEGETVHRESLVFYEMFGGLNGLKLNRNDLLNLSRPKFNALCDRFSKSGKLSVESRRRLMKAWKKERVLIDESRRLQWLVSRSKELDNLILSQMGEDNGLESTESSLSEMSDAIVEAVLNEAEAVPGDRGGHMHEIDVQTLHRHLQRQREQRQSDDMMNDQSSGSEVCSLSMPLKALLMDCSLGHLALDLQAERIVDLNSLINKVNSMDWCVYHLMHKRNVSEDDCYHLMHAVQHLRKEVVFEMHRKLQESIEEKQRIEMEREESEGNDNEKHEHSSLFFSDNLVALSVCVALLSIVVIVFGGS